MEKIDLGEVRTTTRVKDGVKIVVRLFNRKQRQLIIDAVENRPEGKTALDILDIYEVSPAVYYSWVRNEKEREKVHDNQIPNPLEDALEEHINSSWNFSRSDLSAFQANKPEFKLFIENKLKEWINSDLISQINSRVTPENISEVAKAGGVSIEELKAFLRRENLNLTFYSVEAIKRFLKI